MKILRVMGIASAACLLATLMTPVARAAGPANVVISEIHYHPQEIDLPFPDFDDRENTEFLEILNLETTTVDLTGWCFDSAVEYCFAPGTTIAPSMTLVLADDRVAFEAVHGFMPQAIYDGKLSNGGERIRLLADDATVVADMTWQTSDPWPVTPDGNGPSLELQSATGDPGTPANWAASSAIDGNPGSSPTLVAAAPPLVVGRVAPELVTAGENIVISATAVNTAAVTLVYNVDYGSNQSVVMSPVGGQWQATLPALGTGGLIQYRFEASGPGGVTTSPRADDVVSWWAVAVASPQPNGAPMLDLFFTPQNWTNIDEGTCPCTGAVAYEGRIWTGVSVRRAGFTSLWRPKAHLRLDFPDGHPFEASFLDVPVDELTLDAGYPNYDLIREQLGWNVVASLGFPTVSSQHVRVNQSGSFHGLYLLREEQDGNWRARNDLDRGAFYKVESWSPSTFGFSGLWTKKEGLDQPDTDIEALAVCTDQTGAALRTCLLDTTDVPQMINEFAAMIAIWQTDQREFNFFVYRDDTQNGLWRMLPDDMDRSWGSHRGEMINLDATSGKVYRRCVGTDGTPANALCRAFMNVPEFKEMYLRRVRTMADEVLSDPQWPAYVSATSAEIEADWNDDDARWNQTNASLPQATTALVQFFDDYAAHLQAGGHEGNVPGAPSAAPTIMISDYRSDPGDGLGYIMLTNPSGTESVDVSNWTFQGLGAVPPGLVVLPGSTVAVSTNDQMFRAMNPSFTGVRGEMPGTLAGPIMLLRRDGSTAATSGDAVPAPIVLNEWNAVSAANLLANGDATWGSIPGNGGDWFELAVIEHDLDLRGWKLVISDNSGGNQAGRDEFIFSNDPRLSELEAGTILTVSESFADDMEFRPSFGDWHMNVQANSADDGAFFTAASQSNFSTNNDNWQLSIFDANGALVFGPAGEGIGATSSINSSEVGKLQVDPSADVNSMTDFDDGAGSTFGLPNINAGIEQDFSALRYPYVFGDVNCTGTVNVGDALRIAQFSVGNLGSGTGCLLDDPANTIYAAAADVNDNGSINVGDALLIAQCTVGIPNVACPDI